MVRFSKETGVRDVVREYLKKSTSRVLQKMDSRKEDGSGQYTVIRRVNDSYLSYITFHDSKGNLVREVLHLGIRDGDNDPYFECELDSRYPWISYSAFNLPRDYNGILEPANGSSRASAHTTRGAHIKFLKEALKVYCPRRAS